MNTISTSGLLSRLFKTQNIGYFVNRFEKEMNPPAFSDYISNLCEIKNIKQSEVIRNADIERTYGSQLFRGIRKPSREKVIQLCFGFGLNVDEAQELLKIAEKNALYPKIKRDAVILFCIAKQMPIYKAQDILIELVLPLLGGA